MVDVNHLSHRASLEVKHHFDGPYLRGVNLRKGPASVVEFSVATVGHEPKGEIRLLHQQPLSVSHGRAVAGEGSWDSTLAVVVRWYRMNALHNIWPRGTAWSDLMRSITSRIPASPRVATTRTRNALADEIIQSLVYLP